MLSDTVIMITGKPRNGKDTLAREMYHQYGLKRGTCSDAIFTKLAQSIARDDPTLGALTQRIADSLKDSPYKEDLRPLLVRLGNEMTADDPAALVNQLVASGVRIISGVRRREELDAARSSLTTQGFRVVVVWVERQGFVLIRDNTTITASDADVICSVPEGATYLFSSFAKRHRSSLLTQAH